MPQDGRQLALGDSDGVTIWSFPKGKLIRSLIRTEDLANDKANSVRFNPAGTLLAVGYQESEGYLRLWQPANGQILRCLADIDASYWFDDLKSYEYKAADGSKVSVTYPNCSCASPPAGAKCTCDTVEGNRCGCVGHSCPCNVIHIYMYPN